MKIKEAIEQLSKKNPEDEIILAYWEQDRFPEVSDEDWPYACDIGNNKMDWSRTHEDIQELIHYRMSE